MKWQLKAGITKFAASVPWGETIYRFGQRRFGRLNGDPMCRFPLQIKMLDLLSKAQMPVAGKMLLEVGTGHVPVFPIGFFLCGAESVTTVDLHRRLDWGMTRYALESIARNRRQIEDMFEKICPAAILASRLAVLERYSDEPRQFLEAAHITYCAPADAAALPLSADSVDIHFSVTVLEHIPEPVLRKILVEARRVLKPDGVAIHYVDPSDHFQHVDRSILAVNFLRYSDRNWQVIAGNQFAYCNRLRASDYLKLFADLAWEPLRTETTLDHASVEAIRRGFKVDQRFRRYAAEDLATTNLLVVLGKEKRARLPE